MINITQITIPNKVRPHRINPVPVVVIEARHHLGTALARSFGRLGITVYGIGPNRWTPGLNSKYFERKMVWNVNGKESEEVVKFLMYIGKQIKSKSLLMHTTDETAIILAKHADELSKHYIFSKLKPELIYSLVNKKEMHLLAEKHGIPTPSTFYAQSRDDVEKYAEKAKFPVLLKAINSHVSLLQTGRKMFVAGSKKELLNLYNQYETVTDPQFMIQEFIQSSHDSTWMFNGYFNQKSECLFSATGKKIRQPNFSRATSLGICLQNKIIDEISKQFLETINYRGIVDIDYVFNEREKQYKILDINPRIGSTFRLFVMKNGLDVARAQYYDLTGQQVPTDHIMFGRKWLVEDWDLISIIESFHHRKSILRQLTQSFANVQELAWLSYDDPLPFFLLVTSVAHRTLKKLIKKIEPLRTQE